MTSAQAIFAGAALIAASIVFVSTIHPAEAQRALAGTYQLMHHSNTAANAGVFRLDTTSGEVSYCYLTGTSGASVTCSQAIR